MDWVGEIRKPRGPRFRVRKKKSKFFFCSSPLWDGLAFQRPIPIILLFSSTQGHKFPLNSFSQSASAQNVLDEKKSEDNYLLVTEKKKKIKIYQKLQGGSVGESEIDHALHVKIRKQHRVAVIIEKKKKLFSDY